MEIAFIRHGETPYNLIHSVPDQYVDYTVELTEKWKEQALTTKELLKNDSFDAVYSSDMMRAKQTATIIFADSYEIIFDSRLREASVSQTPWVVYNYGDYSKEERKDWRLQWFKDGEPYIDQVQRIKEFLLEMSQHTEYKKIAIVTHNGCLRTLYYIAGTHTLEETLLLERTDNCGVIRTTIDSEGVLKISS